MKKFDLTIVPVPIGTFKSTKVNVGDIARKFRSGSVMFADRKNADGTITEVFIVGTKLGKVRNKMTVTVGNAKNLRPYGDHFVKGVYDFKMKNGMLTFAEVAVATSAYADLLDQTAVVFTQT